MEGDDSAGHYGGSPEAGEAVPIQSDDGHFASSSPTFDHPMAAASIDGYCSDSDYEQISQDEEENQTSDQHYSPNVKEISTALALLRHRHKLSKSCINDFCRLLHLLGVPNVPFDFRSIERNLDVNKDHILDGKRHVVCSACGQKGINESKCDNSKCEHNAGFTTTPTIHCTFRLLPQITSILDRNALMSQPDCRSLSVADVQEGRVCRRIVAQEGVVDPKKRFVTFLLNSDGILLKKCSRSVWITCMVINELHRSIRFDMENIILCSISMGASKPKKEYYQDLMMDWVLELRQLELGFYVDSPNQNQHFFQVHAYLIAASLDKPAQALLMNLNDPTGFYSCVRCTIRGKAS